MSLAKVSKQLKRELKANPTKAGALGVLTVVAAVFWGPLLFKSDEKPKKSAAAGAGVAQPVGATVAGEAAVAAKPAINIDWRTPAKGMSTDPRMKAPATAAGGAETSPFRTKTAQEESEEWLAMLAEMSAASEPAKPAAAPAAPPDFDRYPLELTSTIVGSRIRKAVINGKARNVGSEIEQWNGGSVVLAEVAPRYAVVEWNGKRRELKIPKPGEKLETDAAPTETKAGGETSEAKSDAAESELPAEVLEALGR